MSAENVERVQAQFEIARDTNLVEFFNRLDDAEMGRLVEELYTPDVEISWLASNPDTKPVYRGHEEAAESLTDWLEAWDDFRVEPIEFIDAGDHVLVPNVQRATGKGSGVTTELRSTFVYTVRDGKIARILELDSLDDARAAAERGP